MPAPCTQAGLGSARGLATAVSGSFRHVQGNARADRYIPATVLVAHARELAPEPCSVSRSALLLGEITFPGRLLAEELRKQVGDRSEEDERLLARHQDAAEVLILLR